MKYKQVNSGNDKPYKKRLCYLICEKSRSNLANNVHSSQLVIMNLSLKLHDELFYTLYFCLENKIEQAFPTDPYYEV